MGRPPLGIVSTTVRLPKSVLERIDVLMGENRRAQFIRDAVEAELGRRNAESATTTETPLRSISVPKGIKVKREIHFSSPDPEAETPKLGVPVLQRKAFNPQPKKGKR